MLKIRAEGSDFGAGVQGAAGAFAVFGIEGVVSGPCNGAGAFCYEFNVTLNLSGIVAYGFFNPPGASLAANVGVAGDIGGSPASAAVTLVRMP